MKKNLDKYLLFQKILNVFVIIMIIISLLAIVVTEYNAVKNYSVVLNKEAFEFWCSLFSPFSSLFSGTLVLLSISVALNTYVKSRYLDECAKLVHFREIFAKEPYKTILCKLDREYGEWKEYDSFSAVDESDSHITIWQKNENDINHYLGMLEVLGTLIQKDIISMEDFHVHFGYCLDVVIENPFLMEYIQVKDREHWHSLNELIELYSKHYECH